MGDVRIQRRICVRETLDIKIGWYKALFHQLGHHMVLTKGKKNYTKEKGCLICVLGFNKENLYDEMRWYIHNSQFRLIEFLSTELSKGASEMCNKRSYRRGRLQRGTRKLGGMMNMFIILIEDMVSQVFLHMPKLTTLHTLIHVVYFVNCA